MMLLFVIILLGWFGHIVKCYYLTRRIHSIFTRTILTLLPCIVLSYISCVNLPQFQTTSIMIMAFCWFTSIRLVDLIIFTRDNCPTFSIYLRKIFWIYFPLLPVKSKRNGWPLKFYPILIISKLLVNHWIYCWCLFCRSDSLYGKVLLFYLSILTISYMYDVSIVLVRISTKGQYTLESFTDFPIFSLSLRSFWGQRYNRFVSTVLKESVFEPICWKYSSQSMAALITFIVSGLFHVHMVFVASADVEHLFPTFIFFFLHGVACYLEGYIPNQFPVLLRWLLTNAFLLLTGPLVLDPFIKKGFPFLVVHPPPLSYFPWLPQLPTLNFCR